MRRHYDENNSFEADDEADDDEFAGFAITDDTGKEFLREDGKKKKSYDDGDDEPVEASPIPENEQTVLIDNAKVSELAEGGALTLVIGGEESAALYAGDEKAGDLKPAFVKKLLENRKGWYARCFLFSVSAPVMVKIKFFEKFHKGSTKI